MFLDLAKVYATVSPAKLIDVLGSIGICGIPQKLFVNYLSDRTQCVKINTTTSNATKVKYGIPQGTVLGPVLFILYINDIFTIPTRRQIISYADDMVTLHKQKLDRFKNKGWKQSS